MFKVNNKDTKTTTNGTLNKFLTWFCVSIVNFEQLNAGWVSITFTMCSFKDFVQYIFAIFLSLKKSTFETRKNVLNFTSKIFFVHKILKFQNFRTLKFTTSWNT